MNATLARFASLVLLVAPVACGGIDPNSLNGGRGAPMRTSNSSPTDPGATDPGATDPAADPGAPSQQAPADADAGATTGADAGGSTGTDAAAPANAFTGAGAYAASLGPSTRKGDHNFPANNPPTSPQNQACTNCHNNFLMGGTVWEDAAGTMPAAAVEVRARDAAGNAVSAHTDQDGNFYILKSAAAGFTFPAKVGVRDGAGTKLMSSSIANGTCAASACHVAGKQGPIHM